VESPYKSTSGWEVLARCQTVLRELSRTDPCPDPATERNTSEDADADEDEDGDEHEDEDEGASVGEDDNRDGGGDSGPDSPDAGDPGNSDSGSVSGLPGLELSGAALAASGGGREDVDSAGSGRSRGSNQADAHLAHLAAASSLLAAASVPQGEPDHLATPDDVFGVEMWKERTAMVRASSEQSSAAVGAAHCAEPVAVDVVRRRSSSGGSGAGSIASIASSQSGTPSVELDPTLDAIRGCNSEQGASSRYASATVTAAAAAAAAERGTEVVAMAAHPRARATGPWQASLRVALVVASMAGSIRNRIAGSEAEDHDHAAPARQCLRNVCDSLRWRLLSKPWA